MSTYNIEDQEIEHYRGIAYSEAQDFSRGRLFVAGYGTQQDAQSGQPFPMIVVTICKHELEEENIPSHFVIEPITPELWAPDPVDKEKPNPEVIISPMFSHLLG